MRPRPVIVQFGHWMPDKLRQLPPHRNEGLELVLISSGQLWWQVEGRVERVQPGSIFYTLPWETHGSILEREPGCDLHYVVLALDRVRRRPSQTFGLHRELGLAPGSWSAVRRSMLRAPRRCWPATGRVTQLFPELLSELSRREPSRDAVRALATLLVLEIPRCIYAPGERETRPDSAERVRRFVDRLDAECHLPWTLETMARACGLARTSFTRHLARQTGDRPMMALSRARIRRAQSLLCSSDLPITRIAVQCGFGSSQHFANVFGSYVGCSARAFRRSHARVHPVSVHGTSS